LHTNFFKISSGDISVLPSVKSG